MRQTTILAILFMILAFNAHGAEYKAVATGVRYAHMGDYSVERLNSILSAEVAAFSSLKVQYPQAVNAVSLYKVQYATVIPEQGNKPTLASGLVKAARGFVSARHGIYAYGCTLAARGIG